MVSAIEEPLRNGESALAALSCGTSSSCTSNSFFELEPKRSLLRGLFFSKMPSLCTDRTSPEEPLDMSESVDPPLPSSELPVNVVCP